MPKCGAKIEHLRAYSRETNKYTVTLDSAGNLDWSASEVLESSCTGDQFDCPVCDETLFETDGHDCNPEDVINFLRGK